MRSLIPVLALLSFLAVSGLTASVASAGPDAGGVLWVHDTGIEFSTDLSLPPMITPPADCHGVDNQQDADGVDRIWKVYAAFPEGSSPRLKSTGFGTAFPEDPVHPYIVMNLAGCGGPDDAFMVSNGGFSIHPGEVWMTFSTVRQTTVVELFYFTGAAFTGGSGEPPATWCTVPLVTLAEPVFVDDAVPPSKDLILGYGCLGFGAPGSTPCPQPPTGCCCDQLHGSMSITTQAACLFPSVWLGADVPCNAQTCPPVGACCDHATGDCTVTDQASCVALGVWFEWLGAGVSCDEVDCPLLGCCCSPIQGLSSITTAPNCVAPSVWLGAGVDCDACPPPTGACCFFVDCTIATEAACLMPYRWLGAGVPCEPNPCLLGACCDIVVGSCSWTTEVDCPVARGIWLGPGVPCIECARLGACCDYATGICTVTLEGPCEGSSLVWLGVGVPCHPNPCLPSPIPGACCDLVTGECTNTLEAGCLADWLLWIGGIPCDPDPCPHVGPCCDNTGGCTMTTQIGCSATWLPSGTCMPNPCAPPPVQGACCTEVTGACTVTTQLACQFDWRGAGVPCNTQTCVPPVPTERTSWGQIKNTYR